MHTRTTFAIIGAGAIAQAYAKAFAVSSWAQVVAVADTRLDAARKLASDLGARPFHSHTALLAHQRFDAALICSTPATHCAIALELMHDGKHVLCEKPLSV